MSVPLVVTFICRECGHLGQPVSVWYVDRSGGEHRCAGCGNVVGIWLEQGKLDLGLIEEADRSRFEVHGQ